MPIGECLTAAEFTSFIDTQLPVYDREILRDIRPGDWLATHVSKGTWDAFSGTQHTKDRFRNVMPDLTNRWNPVTNESCAGQPCDPVENQIGWGYDRLTYGQEKQSWSSQLLCFDDIIPKTKAVEHFMQIISDVLNPATGYISSNYVRKKALELAENKFVADEPLTPFTGSWTVQGNKEIYYVPSAYPTSKLTPEMIQRQIPRMRDIGYFGKWTQDPFWGGYQEFAELITDDDTCWEMDKLALNMQLSSQWRYTMWNAAHEYAKYGMGGQIGNYMTHVDANCLRFNRTPWGLQYVPKYINEQATSGIGSTPNPSWYLAQYQISFIWHRFAWRHLVQDLEQVNPMMPFEVRGLNGQWKFVTHDLGADCNGKPIANYRQNKGKFYADFWYGAEPLHTEWLTAFLHLREPRVVYAVAPCAADPGYPYQNYNSANDVCGCTFYFTPEDDSGGDYVLDADTITCNGVVIENGAISESSISALVDALNADTGGAADLGTWAVCASDPTKIELTGATCEPYLPWVD